MQHPDKLSLSIAPYKERVIRISNNANHPVIHSIQSTSTRTVQTDD